MTALNEQVLATCHKLKGAPIAIVYGVPKMTKKSLEHQAPIDSIIESHMHDLDGFLEANGMKTYTIPFDEFKSTQISTIVMHSLTGQSRLSKKVRPTHAGS
jgi:hypothetical protein